MNVSRTMSESALRETRGVHERPTESQVHDAVRTLIRWAGDDPEREGLLDTPARVARAYGEFFQGYDQDPDEILQRTFEESEGALQIGMASADGAPILGPVDLVVCGPGGR